MATVIRTRLVDFSHYQQLITLAFIKANNVKGVAAKATEGNYYIDPHYATNHSRVRGYKVPFWAYHFARPERSSGTAAADWFLAHANLKAGDGILMDAEASEEGQAATHKHLADFALRCATRSPVNLRDIYMSGGYCGNGTGRGQADYYNGHLWYPRYRVTGWPSSWNPGFLSSWQDNTGFHDGPHVWQCSTSPGNFDHDVSWLTIDQLTGGTGVALTQADIEKIADAAAAKVWAHMIDAPEGYGYNQKQYSAANFLSGADAHAGNVWNQQVPTAKEFGYEAETHPARQLLVGADVHPKENAKAIAAVQASVAAVAEKLGAVVDPKALAAAVAAALDPQAIGEAVAASVQASGVVDPEKIAEAVADELGKRIEA